MGKSLCMNCGHIGYLTYLHNDYHCEECYSRNTVAWNDEVKEPRKVLELRFSHLQSFLNYSCVSFQFGQ